MTPNSFVLEFRRRLDGDFSAWVLSALFQEPLVRDFLQESSSARLAFECLSNSPDDWCAARLSLLSNGDPLPLKNLRDQDFVAFEPDLHQVTETGFSTLLTEGSQQPGFKFRSIQDAGLVALALRERYVYFGGWGFLANFISTRDRPADDIQGGLFQPQAMRPAAACLVGMTPEPVDLLSALFQIDPSLAVHAFLCVPEPEAEKILLFNKLMIHLPDQLRYQALQLLANQRPSLASAIEFPGLEPERGKIGTQVTEISLTDPCSVIGETSQMLAEAQALTSSQRPVAAIMRVQEAQELTNRWYSRIQAHLTSLAAQSYEQLTEMPGEDQRDFSSASLQAWELAIKTDPLNMEYQAQYAWALIDQERYEEAETSLEPWIKTANTDRPGAENDFLTKLSFLGWAAAARLAAIQERPADSYNFLCLGIDHLEAAPKETITRKHLLASADLAICSGFGEIAGQITRLGLEEYPADPLTLSRAADAQLMLENPGYALAHASLAYGIAPEISNQRMLIRSLEAAGEWDASLNEHYSLLERLEDVQAEDYYKMGACALQAGQPELCTEMCQRILEIDPQDGNGFDLLGEAALSEGDPGAAVVHFQQAVQFSPQAASAWLHLVDAHTSLGQPESVLETLRQASLAVPGSPEIQLRLGEALIADGSPSLALTAFRQAAILCGLLANAPTHQVSRCYHPVHESSSIVNLKNKIAWKLGKALRQQGYLDESQRIFDASPIARAENPLTSLSEDFRNGFSYDYAQTLLDLGDFSAALPWLELAIADQGNLHARLDLARVLISTSSKSDHTVNELDAVQRSIGILEDILETQTTPATDGLKPKMLSYFEYAEAYALLAEALRRNGELERALHAYRQAIQLNTSDSTRSLPGARSQEDYVSWRVRLGFGLGQVAMELGQFETAVAAFLEAIQVDSSNSFLYRALAEAYAAIDLPTDAFQTANQAIQVDPGDPEALIWYAEHCLRLHNRPTGRAIPAAQAAQEALFHAVEIVPERGDLVVRLAEVYVLQDNHAAALEALNRLVAFQNTAAALDEEMEFVADIAITSEDLQKGAILLCKIGYPAAAALFLDRALSLSDEETGEEATLVKALLFDQQAQAYQEAGDLHASLNAINQAVLIIGDGDTQEKLSFLRHKSSILLERKELPQALASLATARQVAPLAWDLVIQIALVQFGLGALSEASNAAEEAIEVIRQNDNSSARLFLACWIAAESAHLMSDEKRAKAVLEIARNYGPALENACLGAELALQLDDQQAAATLASASLASVLEYAPHHPRVLALQARLVYRQEGNSETCQQLLQTALSLAGDSCSPGAKGFIPDLAAQMPEFSEPFYQTQIQGLAKITILGGLGEAALDLQRWLDACSLSDRIIALAPTASAAYLRKVRTLVRRADMQRLCERLLVVQHAPGSHSLSEAERQVFEQTLLKAADAIDITQGYGVKQVSRWRARGNAVFSLDLDSVALLEALAENSDLLPDDIAAMLWPLGEVEDMEAIQAYAARIPNHLLVSAVAAINLSAKETERALHLVTQAIEHQANPDLNMPDAQPMLLALAAQIELISHNLPEKYARAYQHIQAALGYWPGEARWHDLAAMIFLESPIDELDFEELGVDLEDPILYHLEQAAELEPGLAEHYQKLGRYLALKGETERALGAFTNAAQVALKSPDAWLELAYAQKQAGLLTEAIQSCERALAFANQSVEALLLRCELALLTNNPRGALSRAQIILNIIPDQPEALFIFAQALESLDEPGEALITIEKAIAAMQQAEMEEDGRVGMDSQAPGSQQRAIKLLEMQRQRVRLIQRMNGSKSAIEAIYHLEMSYPDDPVLKTSLANYLLETGEPEKACQAARTALQAGAWELDFNTQARLHYMIGAYSRQIGQLDQALYHLNQAVQLSPEFLDAYLELGRTHQDRRQNSQALESYQMAARRMPNDYRPYYYAGLAMKEAKDYLGAETMFRRAAHLAPSEVSIHRQLAAVVALNLIHNRRLAASD